MQKRGFFQKQTIAADQRSKYVAVAQSHDEQKVAFAKKSCKHCNGTGRIGFVEGKPHPCRCVVFVDKKDLEQQDQKGAE